jgi:hypothetical protein
VEEISSRDENEIKKSGKTYFGSGAVENGKLVSGAVEISSRYFDSSALEIFLPLCLGGLVVENLWLWCPPVPCFNFSATTPAARGLNFSATLPTSASRFFGRPPARFGFWCRFY